MFTHTNVIYSHIFVFLSGCYFRCHFILENALTNLPVLIFNWLVCFLRQGTALKVTNSVSFCDLRLCVKVFRRKRRCDSSCERRNDTVLCVFVCARHKQTSDYTPGTWRRTDVHLENPEYHTRWYFKYFLGKGQCVSALCSV